jgi:hypothetical protein
VGLRYVFYACYTFSEKNLLQVRLVALENQFREKVEGGNMLEER